MRVTRVSEGRAARQPCASVGRFRAEPERCAPVRSARRGRAFWRVVAALSLGLTGCQACSSAQPARGTSSADAGAAGLSPEQAQQVLAQVGTRTITLGDYAAALERMDPFERMRYQTE